MEKVTVGNLLSAKGERKIAMTTAYDYPTGRLADQAEFDIVLVGDSVGNVVLGYDATTPVTMDEMIHHCKAVSRGVDRALLVGDMPFMSFHVSPEDAVRNAGRFVKEGGCDAVKLEGGENFAEATKAIVEAGIPVMAHVGLLPATAPMWSGYKLKAKTAEQANELVREAEVLEDAGAFSMVLEMVTAEAAHLVTEQLDVPTIGIGAGPACDGQVLVLHDVVGLYEEFKPKFAKRYANVADEMRRALTSFREEVYSGRFPGEEHTFHMEEDERQKLDEEAGTSS